MQSTITPGPSGERTGPAGTMTGTHPQTDMQNEKNPGIPGCIRKMS